jgi:hypothetical protein
MVRDALRCGLPARHTRTLLIVDQLEELWTLTASEQTKAIERHSPAASSETSVRGPVT